MTDIMDSGIEKLAGRTKILVPVLNVGLVISIALFLLKIAELAGMWSFDQIDNMESPWVIAYSILAVVFAVVYYGTVVVFGMWIHLAASNIVEAEVHGFDYTPGWAVGWYFIPFVNLLKPFQAMRQIWNASHGANVELNENNSTLTVWWASWLIFIFSANFSTQISINSSDPKMYTIRTLLEVVNLIASLVLFPIAVKMVRNISFGQQQYLRLRTLEEQFS